MRKSTKGPTVVRLSHSATHISFGTPLSQGACFATEPVHSVWYICLTYEDVLLGCGWFFGSTGSLFSTFSFRAQWIVRFMISCHLKFSGVCWRVRSLSFPLCVYTLVGAARIFGMSHCSAWLFFDSLTLSHTTALEKIHLHVQFSLHNTRNILLHFRTRYTICCIVFCRSNRFISCSILACYCGGKSDWVSWSTLCRVLCSIIQVYRVSSMATRPFFAK